MRFHSILGRGSAALWGDDLSAKDAAVSDLIVDDVALVDLNIDQLVSAFAAESGEYRLESLFRRPLRDVDVISYRNEVFRDLERLEIRRPIEEFVAGLGRVRSRQGFSERMTHPHQKTRWHFDAVVAYCDSVTALGESLARLRLDSKGLTEWREYLQAYLGDAEFTRLRSDTRDVADALAGIRYSIRVDGDQVTVDRFDGAEDYSATIEELFTRFRSNGRAGRRPRPVEWSDMNPLEEQILGSVRELYQDEFRMLGEYSERNRRFLDPTIDVFGREIHFYLVYLRFMRRFTETGLRFCYPEVSTTFEGIYAEDAYDLALAATKRTPVVCNSFELTGQSRMLVVTGPNQGGKTTYARMFAQLPYLAGLGCPVPAASARLLLPDRLFTHFEHKDAAIDSEGRLHEELSRMHEMLASATEHSLIVMNESFSSTTTDDAVLIGAEVLRRIIDRGAIGLYVTFLDELSGVDPAVVSMVAEVDSSDTTRRTFRIERRPADGQAHAAVLADRYGLTYESIVGTIAE